MTIDGFNVLNQTNYLIPNNVIGTGTDAIADVRPSNRRGGPAAAAGWRAVELLMRRAGLVCGVVRSRHSLLDRLSDTDKEAASSRAVARLGMPALANANPTIAAEGTSRGRGVGRSAAAEAPMSTWP